MFTQIPYKAVTIIDYKPNKKRQILIVFDDLIVDIKTNKRVVKSYLLKGLFINLSYAWNSIDFLYLPNNLVFLFQKKSE